MESDVPVIFTIHHGGKFIRDPKLKYVNGEKLKWKVYDIDRLGYFRIMKKLRSMGYAGNVKVYSLPSGHSVENGLKFMFNDAFIYDLLVVSKVFDKLYMELYVEHAVDVPEIIQDPILLMYKETISSDDDELGDVVGDHVEEAEGKALGDICDLTMGEHLNVEQSRLVNVDLKDITVEILNDEVSVSLQGEVEKENNTSSPQNVQQSEGEHVEDAEQHDKSLQVTGDEPAVDQVAVDEVQSKVSNNMHQVEGEHVQADEPQYMKQTNTEQVEADEHDYVKHIDEEQVEADLHDFNEVVDNIVEADHVIQEEDEVVQYGDEAIEQEVEIGDVPSSANMNSLPVDTDCDFGVQKEVPTDSVHEDRDVSDEVDFEAGDGSGSDANDEELATARGNLRAEAQLEKEK